MRIQPDEAIYIKMVNKNPGLGLETGVSELDLTYHDRYPDAYIPDAYERLILDAIRGDQQHFVRRCASCKAQDYCFTKTLECQPEVVLHLTMCRR